MKIYFLNHSGFVVEEEKRAYVFDYNEDPQDHVRKIADQGKELWFFVTHIHGDHFNPLIKKFCMPTTKFFVHEDVHLHGIAPHQVHMMKVDDHLTVEGVHIHMYGSTDEGGSFAVMTEENSFYHAGDLNWWHWLGDTDENNAQARENYVRELKRIEGLEVDYAFFPVDARLEEAREWGVLSFLRRVNVRKCLIPMHYFGASWKPSLYFKNLFPQTKLWIPEDDGEICQFE